MISAQEGRSGQLTTWSIRAVVLVAFLDLFMQLPVISAYAKSLGATASMGGAIVGMYSASNLAGNVGAGALLDRLNRKRLIAVGMLLTAASLYLYNFTETPGQLLALRAFHGLAAGVLAPGAFTMLGDHTTGHHTRSIGMTGALIAVSAVIGPPVAGVIRDLWGFGAVFTTSGTLMLLAAVVFWVRVPAIPMETVEGQDAGGRRLAAGMWRRLIPVFCAVLAMTFGIGSLINHLPIALEVAGAAPRTSGIAFATFSLVATMVMGSPAHRKVDDISRRLAVSAGAAAALRQRRDTGSLERRGNAGIRGDGGVRSRFRSAVSVACGDGLRGDHEPSQGYRLRHLLRGVLAGSGVRVGGVGNGVRDDGRARRAFLRERGGRAGRAADGGLHTGRP